MKRITDLEFMVVAKVFLPEYIKVNNFPYSLHAYVLLAGGYRISYVNNNLESEVRIAFDEIWEDPLDCIKVIYHRLNRNIDTWLISKQQYDELNEKFLKSNGVEEKVEK